MSAKCILNHSLCNGSATYPQPGALGKVCIGVLGPTPDTEKGRCDGVVAIVSSSAVAAVVGNAHAKHRGHFPVHLLGFGYAWMACAIRLAKDRGYTMAHRHSAYL